MRCLRTTIAMMAMASPGMTKSLSKEVGGRNIRVNLVCPGLIATPMTQRMNQAQGRQHYRHNHMTGWMILIESIALACVQT